MAIVWGPLAGYFAKQSRVAMEVVPVSPQIDQPFLPFVFDISMGVRRDDQELRDQVEQVLEKRRDEIDRILESYGVLTYDSLRDLAHTDRWETPFSVVLARAIETGHVRRLSDDLYEAG